MFESLGISTDVIILVLFAGFIILLVLWAMMAWKLHVMRSRLRAFMGGRNARSLEDNLLFKLDLVDDLLEANSANEREIAALKRHMRGTFQKYGLVKYDALEEQGGKLSFTLALLDEKDDGIVMNMVHSREGCFCYLKEIIDGRSLQTLAPEEDEALGKALGFETEHVEHTSAKSVKALKDQFTAGESEMEKRIADRMQEKETAAAEEEFLAETAEETPAADLSGAEEEAPAAETAEPAEADPAETGIVGTTDAEEAAAEEEQPGKTP